MLARTAYRQTFADKLQRSLPTSKILLSSEPAEAILHCTASTASASTSDSAISSTLLTSEAERRAFLDRLAKSRPSTHPRMKLAAQSDKKYAVFVPLLLVDGRPALLFTLRANHMNEHRGQVSFPGGAVEPGETVASAALREMHEEIGLRPEDAQVWAELHPMLTRALQHTVTPIIGVINVSPNALTPQQAEVQEVFTVFLDDLCSRTNVRHTQFRSDPVNDSAIAAATRRNAGYSLPVFLGGKYRIWGLTAGLLHQTLSLLVPHAYKSPLKFVSM